MAETVKVKSGQSLSSIAAANNTTVQALLNANPKLTENPKYNDGRTLFSGTTITIPDAKPSTSTSPNLGNRPLGGTVNTTTLEGIAKASDTSPNLGDRPLGGNIYYNYYTGEWVDSPDKIKPRTTTSTATSSDSSSSGGKKEVSRKTNADGTITITYDDGTTETIGTPSTGKKVVRTEILGSGANRVIRTYYDDGTFTDTPSPDTSQQGMSPEDIQKLIDAAIAKATSGFEAQLKAQQAAAEKARQDQLAKERKSAFDIIAERFTQMGVPEFGDVIAKIFRGEATDRRGGKFDEIPTTSEGFYLQLIQTQPYYERFGQVNEARLAAGYRALDEKTIVGMEDEYQKVLTSYNAPKGFYDQTKDFQMFLKNNYTAVDVSNVFQAYRDFVQSTNPVIRGQLKDLYGINDDMLTAYFADPERGQPILESITGKNLNTAAALLEGLTKEQADIAQQYGAGSLAYGTQRQKFSQVSRNIQQYGNLAEIYGENFGAREAIAAEFGADTAAQQVMERLRATNLAQFSGTSGVGQRALRQRAE